MQMSISHRYEICDIYSDVEGHGARGGRVVTALTFGFEGRRIDSRLRDAPTA